jgi:hypothetical protein
MALITCKDCKKEFSTDALRCPHCGAKKPSQVGMLLCILRCIVVAPTGAAVFAVALNPFAPSSPQTPVSFSEQMRNNDHCKTTPTQDKALKEFILRLDLISM